MTIQILKSAQAYLLALALALGQFAVTEDALADDKKWFDSCAANITGVSALGGTCVTSLKLTLGSCVTAAGSWVFDGGIGGIICGAMAAASAVSCGISIPMVIRTLRKCG